MAKKQKTDAELEVWHREQQLERYKLDYTQGLAHLSQVLHELARDVDKEIAREDYNEFEKVGNIAHLIPQAVSNLHIPANYRRAHYISNLTVYLNEARDRVKAEKGQS